MLEVFVHGIPEKKENVKFVEFCALFPKAKLVNYPLEISVGANRNNLKLSGAFLVSMLQTVQTDLSLCMPKCAILFSPAQQLGAPGDFHFHVDLGRGVLHKVYPHK